MIFLPTALESQSSDPLKNLLEQASIAGRVPGFENAYVRVTYTLLEYTATRDRSASARPVLLYVRLQPSPGRLNTRPLLPPRGSAPIWRPGVVPRAVEIDLLAPPPPPPQLGTVGTEPPRGTVEETSWDGGRLLLATYRPLDYSVGAGPYPSVTAFVSDGVVEVSSRGLRRRMAVQAGDAFWFDAGTRITVMDDYPLGAAIVQLIARR
jgi:hypothetical protein